MFCSGVRVMLTTLPNVNVKTPLVKVPLIAPKPTGRVIDVPGVNAGHAEKSPLHGPVAAVDPKVTEVRLLTIAPGSAESVMPESPIPIDPLMNVAFALPAAKPTASNIVATTALQNLYILGSSFVRTTKTFGDAT
jgi:hypothetical protein